MGASSRPVFWKWSLLSFVGMAYVLALLPLGVGAFKIYQNMQPDARQANSKEMREKGIIERLSTGATPRLSQMSDKQFDKFVRTNSVGKNNAEELRRTRSKLLGKTDASEQSQGA